MTSRKNVDLPITTVKIWRFSASVILAAVGLLFAVLLVLCSAVSNLFAALIFAILAVF
ncbi:hypothetical protein RQN30_09175 [Arcanobacterium hippocoleae]